MKNKYYIFLDIDGTLWDLTVNPYLVSSPLKLKKESVTAVNNLIEGLKHKGYAPHLVITSGLRNHWNTCSETLFVNGINNQVPMQPLFVNQKFTRGEKISIFLHDKYNNKPHGQQRDVSFLDNFKTNFAKKVDNYVVIDDFVDGLKNIPKQNLIHTSMFKSSLNDEMVTSYLEIVPPYRNECEYEM